MPAGRKSNTGRKTLKRPAAKKGAKSAKKKASKAAAKKKPAKKVKTAPKKALKRKGPAEDTEEIAFLFDKLQSEEKTERAWRTMTAGEEAGENDALEEELDREPKERENAERSWKYFGK